MFYFILILSTQTDAGAAILDEMKLELTDMKISKVLVRRENVDGAADLGKIFLSHFFSSPFLLTRFMNFPSNNDE